MPTDKENLRNLFAQGAISANILFCFPTINRQTNMRLSPLFLCRIDSAMKRYATICPRHVFLKSFFPLYKAQDSKAPRLAFSLNSIFFSHIPQRNGQTKNNTNSQHFLSVLPQNPSCFCNRRLHAKSFGSIPPNP